RLRRAPSMEIRRRVANALALTHLRGFERRYPQQLSGGQQQRVAMARVLAIEPDVLLLDEPFSALDATLRARVRAELEAVRERFGVPMVLISHDLEDVARLADTLVLFEPGRVASVAHRDAREPEALVRLAAASLQPAAP
ncbi:MAG: ATP-binding cassette domain-containing protein, partial [Burkholderiales bacterium]|nr:ATP-binding cassette domain-containing protein [Burkholderiales bacterium]